MVGALLLVSVLFADMEARAGDGGVERGVVVVDAAVGAGMRDLLRHRGQKERDEVAVGVLFGKESRGARRPSFRQDTEVRESSVVALKDAGAAALHGGRKERRESRRFP